MGAVYHLSVVSFLNLSFFQPSLCSLPYTRIIGRSLLGHRPAQLDGEPNVGRREALVAVCFCGACPRSEPRKTTEATMVVAQLKWSLTDNGRPVVLCVPAGELHRGGLPRIMYGWWWSKGRIRWIHVRAELCVEEHFCRCYQLGE